MDRQHSDFQTRRPMAPVISTGEWVVTLLLLAIPIVNIIMLFVWAFGGGANPSKANYSKAALIWALIGIVLYLLIFVIFLGAVGSSIHSFSNM